MKRKARRHGASHGLSPAKKKQKTRRREVESFSQSSTEVVWQSHEPSLATSCAAHPPFGVRYRPAPRRPQLRPSPFCSSEIEVHLLAAGRAFAAADRRSDDDDLVPDLDDIAEAMMGAEPSGGKEPSPAAAVLSLWRQRRMSDVDVGCDALEDKTEAPLMANGVTETLRLHGDVSLAEESPSLGVLELMMNLTKLQSHKRPLGSSDKQPLATKKAQLVTPLAPLPAPAQAKAANKVPQKENKLFQERLVPEAKENVCVLPIASPDVSAVAADITLAVVPPAFAMDDMDMDISEEELKQLEMAEEIYKLSQLAESYDFDDSCFSQPTEDPATTAAQTVPSETDSGEREGSVSSKESSEGAELPDVEPTAGKVEAVAEPRTQASLTPSDAMEEEEEQPANPYQRYQVVSVQRTPPDLYQTLQLYSEPMSEQRTVHLRDQWARTKVASGDFVNVIGDFDMSKDVPDLCISKEKNLLILHPDILFAGTTVGSSYRCLRKAVLTHKCKWPIHMKQPGAEEGGGEEAEEDKGPKRPPATTPDMLYGEMVHLLMERALQAGDFTTEFLREHQEQIIKVNLLKLQSISQSAEAARARTGTYIAALQTWAQSHLCFPFKSSLPKKRGPGVPLGKQIHRVLAVEENIWSPRFGLQGKIDASVAVAVSKDKLRAAPLELKTGRVTSQYGQVPHRAQLALYTLLMSDRYGVPIQKGLLYYAKPPTNKMIDAFAPWNELMTLVQSRNEMAHYIQAGARAAESTERQAGGGNEEEALPAMLKDEKSCSRCHHRANCFLYHRATEGGTAETSGTSELFKESVGHVDAEQAEFLRMWDRFIDMEANESIGLRQEIWTMPSAERQQQGRCCSNMFLAHEARVSRCAPATPVEAGTSGKGGALLTRRGHLYRFEQRSPSSAASQDMSYSGVFGKSGTQPVAGTSLLDLYMSRGDFVVVSTEDGHVCMGRGIVKSISPTSISVLMDEKLQLPPDPADACAPRTLAPSVTDIEDLAGTPAPSLRSLSWRIDKDNMTSIFNIMKGNIFRMLLGKDFHMSRIRQLVVNKRKPRFGAALTVTEEKLKGLVLPYSLNDDQLRTVKTVLRAEDYTMVLGMPGTGKTTTIACLVKALVAMGKSVLLTAYTHSAVDTLLFKLEEMEVPFARLGREESISAGLRKYSVSGSNASLEDLTAMVKQTQVLATTCLGVNDPVLTMKEFDYCIVDEASQITLPVCLGPIFCADKFILVGDHNQLPPLVRNEKARKEGMAESLFKKLCEAHPSAVVNLGFQYRMHSDIMALSNHLVYDGQLKCGTDMVATATLSLPLVTELPTPKLSTSQHWLRDVLLPERPMLFLDTDAVPCPEGMNGTTMQNPTEVKLVVQLCAALVAGGVAAQDVGVISPYRAQLDLIYTSMKKLGLAVETNTVDKYQGKDKEAVILSLVRSNDTGEIGELLQDWRRVNVAFTRAKKKLLVIGSRRTLKCNAVFRRFLSLVDKRGWAMQLPKAAHHTYPPLKCNRSTRR